MYITPKILKYLIEDYVLKCECGTEYTVWTADGASWKASGMTGTPCFKCFTKAYQLPKCLATPEEYTMINDPTYKNREMLIPLLKIFWGKTWKVGEFDTVWDEALPKVKNLCKKFARLGLVIDEVI